MTDIPSYILAYEPLGRWALNYVVKTSAPRFIASFTLHHGSPADLSIECEIDKISRASQFEMLQKIAKYLTRLSPEDLSRHWNATGKMEPDSGYTLPKLLVGEKGTGESKLTFLIHTQSPRMVVQLTKRDNKEFEIGRRYFLGKKLGDNDRDELVGKLLMEFKLISPFLSQRNMTEAR